MSLHGSIETFAVADVLRLLAATFKSGRLHVQGPTRAGTVWVHNASIVGIDRSSSPYLVEPAEELFQLLRLERGSFRFELGQQPVEPVGPVDIEAVLVEAESMLAEWQDLEARIPSAQSWVQLQPVIDATAVTLSREEWLAVVAISGGCSLAGVGDALETGELLAARMVSRLMDLGLVEIGEAPLDLVPPEELRSAEIPVAAEVSTSTAAVAGQFGPAGTPLEEYVRAEIESDWLAVAVIPPVSADGDLYSYPGLIDPAAPALPSAPLAPVGSWGAPASLFTSGPPQRLAPPPPPPPAAGSSPSSDSTGVSAGGDSTVAADADLEQQLLNLSPRAREAIKQSAGLQPGLPGR